jgi:hypothetical protein
MTEDEKINTLRVRQEKTKLSLGQGEDMAPDEWCYNCAGSGHWGDVSPIALFPTDPSDNIGIQDCKDLPHRTDLPREPSAFSSYNIMSGPFFDPAAEPMPKASRRTEPRDWRKCNDFLGGWGNHAPENVGKQGRKKNMAKMERSASQQAVDADTDDWFENPINAGNRSAMKTPSRRDGGSGKEPPTGPKKLTFGPLKNAGRTFPSRPASLLDRLGGDDSRGSSRAQYGEQRHPHSSRETSRSKHDLREQRNGGYSQEPEDKNRYRSRDEPGPRYKGGYRR